MTDVPVDNAARGAAPEGLTLAEEEELRAELAKVRDLGCVLLGRSKHEPRELLFSGCFVVGGLVFFCF